jgi:peptidylprolyl isomerase
VRTRHQIAAAAAALILGLAGCGDDDDEPAGTGTTEAADSGPVNLKKKPVIEVPDGEPPAGLEIKDLKVGDGATAKSGDTVTVQYVGVSYSTGQQFDASWDGAGPFSFTIDGGDVIPGWDQGVAGMKVGGRRQLTIPPELGYGEAGSPPDIAPNETLIFVVDLLNVG